MKVFVYTVKGKNKAASEDRVLVGSDVYLENYIVTEIKSGNVVIADGVGGNMGGAVAAYQLCKRLADIVEPNESDFTRINEYLLEKGETDNNCRDMATTATGIYFYPSGEAYGYHVGNTRVYAIQAGQYLNQLTEDDTVVSYLIKTGKLTQEEADNYPAKNEITACFGGGKRSLLRIKKFRIDTSRYQQFMFTCDGIHDVLSIDDLEDILAESDEDWDKAVHSIVSTAQENGSEDDCSVIIVDCQNKNPLASNGVQDSSEKKEASEESQYVLVEEIEEPED